MRRKLQRQPVYGSPTDRVYFRLRLPSEQSADFVAKHGEWPKIWVESANTLRIGPNDSDVGEKVHILEVREIRNAMYKRFRQVMFPIDICGGMKGGEYVDISFTDDNIRLGFERNIFRQKLHQT